jgi:hypothetical protein
MGKRYAAGRDATLLMVEKEWWEPISRQIERPGTGDH